MSSQYDLLGRVRSQVKKAAGEDLSYKYDLAGNVLEVTDTVYPMWYLPGTKVPSEPSKTSPRTTKQYFGYDALNRVVSATDTYWSEAAKSGHTTHTRYDALGRVEAVWARDGKVRWFGYDAVGRQVQEIWTASAKVPDKELTAGAGNALARPLSADGATVLMSYADAGDRVRYAFQASDLKVQTVGGSVSVTPAAGTEWKVNPYTQTRFEYDGLGRVKTETPQEKTETTPGLSLSYWYDAAGRVVKVSDSQQGWQATEYDRAGRVTARVLSDDGKGKGAHFQFEYRAGEGYSEDRVKTILGRSGTTKAGAVDIRAKLSYDALGREVEREWDDPALPNHKEWLITRYADNGLVSTETRRGAPTLHPAHPQVNWNWAHRSVRYHYDEFNQVKRQDTIDSPEPNSAIVGPPGTETKRDASGNGVYLNEAEAQKPGHRVTVQGDYSLWYDAANSKAQQQLVGTAGNVTMVDNKSTSEVEYFEYDTRNRLVSVLHVPYLGKVGSHYRINYVYDTFDRLVAREKTEDVGQTQVGSDATRYVYADGHLYADAVVDGTITVRYLFGPDGAPLANIERLHFQNPAFYLTDRQNSVLQIVDGGGQTLKRVRYSGLEVKPGDRVINPVWILMDRLELGGQMYDHFAELSRQGDQWYDPAIGRNLTEGGRGIGLNPYPVAQNNWPNEGGTGGEPDAGSRSYPGKPSWWEVLLFPSGGTQWAAEVTRGTRYEDTTGILHGIVKGIDLPRNMFESSGPRRLYHMEQRWLQNPPTDKQDLWEDFGAWMLDGGPLPVANPFFSFEHALQDYRAARGRHLDRRVAGAQAVLRNLWGARNGWMIEEGLDGAELGGPNDGAKLTAGERAERITGGILGFVMDATLVVGMFRGRGASGRGRAAPAAAKPAPVSAVAEAAPPPSLGVVARTFPEFNRKTAAVVHDMLPQVPVVGRLHQPLAWTLNKLGFKVCFTGRMPMRAEHGAVRADAVVVGMRLLARDEYDPEGAVVPCGACNFFCVRSAGPQFAGHVACGGGRRPSNTMAKWLSAAFRPTMGLVHFFDASWIARYTNFSARSAFGYCFRFRVNVRITLFTDSIALVV